MSASASAGSRTGPAPARLVGALTEVLEPVATAAGFDLEEIEVMPAGRRRLLRVVVDRDGGLDLDAVAVVSQSLATALDASDAMGESAYTLEVTSPGVDRPLTQPRHWRRATGRLVRVRPRGGGAEIRGRIARADDTSVTIVVGAEERTSSYDDLGSGRIEIEFNRPGSEGGES